jgi:simple sugar transport system permease protein
MLAAAFGAAAIAAITNNVWLGLSAGLAVSLATAGLQGLAAITLKGNQLIAGVAINMLAAGLTTFLGIQIFAQGGRTPQLTADGRFQNITLPFASELSRVPIVGQIYSDLISGHNLLVYIAFIAVPVTWFVLYRTRFGLRLRAVGENPRAVDTAGISVTRLRYQAVLITGLLCGFAGAFFSIAQGNGFGNNMTAGKGFIALAALIFAKWRPVPAMLPACFLVSSTRCRSGCSRPKFSASISPCRPSRRSHTFSRWSCLRASSAKRSDPRLAACLTSRNASKACEHAKRRVAAGPPGAASPRRKA